MSKDKRQLFMEFMATFYTLSDSGMKPLVVITCPEDTAIDPDDPTKGIKSIVMFAPELNDMGDILKLLEQIVSGQFNPKELLQ